MTDLNPNIRDRLPVVVIVPGLTGGSDSTYIMAQVNEFARHGFRAVVFNPRGVGLPQITTKIFDASHNVDDLHYVLKKLFQRYPAANFYLAGSSFGACCSVRYVATFDHNDRIKGVVSMANPFDLYKAAQHINNPPNKLFGKYMTKNLINKYRHNETALKKWQDERGVDLGIHTLDQIEDPFELDNRVTFKLHPQYNDHKAYYDKVSCAEWIDKVKIPTLFLHSKEDPICP